MITRTTDAKGRINLGKRFANKTFIVEETDDLAIKLAPARVVPEREAWLYDNPEAVASVMRGLAQAKVGRFSTSLPDLEADRTLDHDLGEGE